MIEARRKQALCFRRNFFAKGLDEREEFLPVKGEGCPAASESVGRVGHGRELRASEVVAVHGDVGGDLGQLGVVAEVTLVDQVGHGEGEFGFAGAWDAADGDEEAGGWGGGEVFVWVG